MNRNRKSIALIMILVFMINMLTACTVETSPVTPSEGAPAQEATAAPAAEQPKPAITKRNMVIIDPGGEQDMFQEIVERFKAAYPDYVGDVEWVPASTGETIAKLSAEQAAKVPYCTLVITGYDCLAAGIDAGVYLDVLGEYSDKIPSLANLSDDAKLQMDAGQGFGIPHLLSIGGPMFTYWPDKIPNPPKNLDELLAFAKANPGKFAYPKTSNSGAGYAFLQGLPYLAGEADVNDPEKWTKVWDYLKELDQYIEYYTPGSALLYRDFNEGTRWIITTAVGYETNQRVMGAMAPECKQLFMDDLHWVTDSNFFAIPKGLSQEDIDLSLLFIEFSLSPEIQALMYDGGFMYPGPVIKGLTLADAPQESQDMLNAVLTPELLAAIENYPHVGPMSTTNLVKAFEIWDEQIGTNKIKE